MAKEQKKSELIKEFKNKLEQIFQAHLQRKQKYAEQKYVLPFVIASKRFCSSIGDLWEANLQDFCNIATYEVSVLDFEQFITDLYAKTPIDKIDFLEELNYVCFDKIMPCKLCRHKKTILKGFIQRQSKQLGFNKYTNRVYALYETFIYNPEKHGSRSTYLFNKYGNKQVNKHYSEFCEVSKNHKPPTKSEILQVIELFEGNPQKQDEVCKTYEKILKAED
ncbi:MAG: hypothetical protein RMJ97_11670 [Raineya sp.]|nr:hypothetical protein [Raineya sp.]